MDLRDDSRRRLRKISELAERIECTATDGQFPMAELDELISRVSDLEKCSEAEIQKLSHLKNLLHPNMSLRHFLNFSIPIERALGKCVADGDLHITFRDRADHLVKRDSIPLVFVLENLRSAFNVGSMARLADAVGAEALYLCGYTPAPQGKTALGSEKSTPIKNYPDLHSAIVELKKNGYLVYALETSNQAISIYNMSFVPTKTAMIVGNERFGLEPAMLNKELAAKNIDGLLQIPMQGFKNSLNVACCLSVASYEFYRQFKQPNQPNQGREHHLHQSHNMTEIGVSLSAET